MRLISYRGEMRKYRVPFALFLISFAANTNGQTMRDVRFWAYQIQGQNLNNSIQKMADSRYDLLVIDNMRSVKGDEMHPNAQDVSTLKNSTGSRGQRKLVVCYIDIGEAEDYRYYWKDHWKVGNPEWIVAPDPDGWDGNYPVKYWRKAWKDIVFGSDSAMIDRILADGYDGIYLDWVEAFEFTPVDSSAQQEGLDARIEMIRFISEIAAYCRAKKPGFIVIPQNATAIVLENDSWTQQYLQTIDAIAQEDIWFDGEADQGGKEGDIPIDPQLTQEYITNLRIFQTANVPVITVDYAQLQPNVDSCYRAAGRLGYIEYVALRQLNELTKTPPPGLLSTLVPPIANEPEVHFESYFPNPSSGTVSITYSIARSMPVVLHLYNTLGQPIREWTSLNSHSGRHSSTLDISTIPSGIYTLQLQSGSFSQTRQIAIKH